MNPIKLLFILLAFTTLSIAGCRGEETWIVGLEITPERGETRMGESYQFAATVIWDDGHRGENAAAIWSTEDSSVATIGSETGLAIPAGVGETEVYAERAGDISDTAILVVLSD